MPNHCVNEIIFRDVDRPTQHKILALVCGKKGVVDFEVLVPSPNNIWCGSVSQKHEKTFPRTHLDWARENWGTKWNAYDHRPVEMTEDTLTLCFETAWGPPYGWIVALFNTVKCKFEHNWFSEGGAPAIHGVFDYAKMDSPGTDPWSEEEGDEAFQRRMHKLLYGVEAF